MGGFIIAPLSPRFGGVKDFGGVIFLMSQDGNDTRD